MNADGLNWCEGLLETICKWIATSSRTRTPPLLKQTLNTTTNVSQRISPEIDERTV